MGQKMRLLLERLEPTVFRALMALPPAVQRRLAGPPVQRDGQVLDPETQWMLRIQQLVRIPGAETLPLPDGRAALVRQSSLVGGRQPVGEVRELEVPGAEGKLPARLYVPRGQVSTGSTTRDGSAGGAPLLFFIHGGGMIYGDLDSPDALCRFLAQRADVRVLAVDYRLAPEHPFPAAVEDCWAALQWAVENADQLGVDPHRIAVGGDSAGGSLSAVTAIRAAEADLALRYQLLIYPVTDMTGTTESRRLFGEGFFLTSDFIALAERSYLADGDDRRDPRVSVLFTEQFPSGLAPAFVATAGFDPLRDEGEAYARRLAGAGVEVELKRYPGFIHGFANVVGVGRSSRAAVAEMAAKLKAALAA